MSPINLFVFYLSFAVFHVTNNRRNPRRLWRQFSIPKDNFPSKKTIFLPKRQFFVPKDNFPYQKTILQFFKFAKTHAKHYFYYFWCVRRDNFPSEKTIFHPKRQFFHQKRQFSIRKDNFSSQKTIFRDLQRQQFLCLGDDGPAAICLLFVYGP